MLPQVNDERNADPDRTEQSPHCNRLVHALFEERVRDRPDSLAVTCDGVSLTYQDLDDRANALASVLSGIWAVGPETLVALVLDRSEQVLIAMLAVLKAGGAYVTLSPDSPDRRIEAATRLARARSGSASHTLYATSTSRAPKRAMPPTMDASSANARSPCSSMNSSKQCDA